jgi:Predicted HD superfamily hydrolase
MSLTPLSKLISEGGHIAEVANEVQNRLLSAEAGHDWHHITRVYSNAMLISQTLPHLDLEVVKLAVLLHDIADAKFHNGDESLGPKVAREIMQEHCFELSIIDHVIMIIKHMSFKNTFDNSGWTSPELDVVQDADRLDAIGAIGVARAFTYGGFKNHPLFDINIPPRVHMTKAEYKSKVAPTFNHFYEKLLKLKGMMNTDHAAKMAEQRHKFMVTYLDQFYDEIGITPSWHDL